MAQVAVELKISKFVDGLSDEASEYIPPSGSTVKINVFSSGGETGSGLVNKIFWKYGTGSQELIWSLSPGVDMPFSFIISPAEVDGVNKLAVVSENTNVTDKYMACVAYIQVDS